MVVRPHRASTGDVASLATRLPKFTGMAVVHQPLVGYVLLGGERRFAAHVHRGDAQVEVYMLRDWRDWVAWMSRDLEMAKSYGFERVPMDPVTAGYLDGKAQSLLKPRRQERPSYDVAEYANLPEAHVSNARLLIRDLETEEVKEVRDLIAEQLIEIRKGVITPHAAVNRVTMLRKRLTAPERPVADQKRILTNAEMALAGLADALAAIGVKINPAMPKADAEKYVEVLLTGRAAIEKTIRTLRTHIREGESA